MLKGKCLFLGTFDPFTNGHLEVVHKALGDFDQVNIVVMENKQKKAFLSPRQRVNIIKSLQLANVSVSYWPGLATSYMQKHNLFKIVRGYRSHKDLGYEKWLFKRYQQVIASVKITLYQTSNQISSTQVKEILQKNQKINHLVPWKTSILNKA